MDRRSKNLQYRLRDVKQRLRAMRTVTNTASAEISGGETRIDTDGNVSFHDGGRLLIGGGEVVSTGGRVLISADGTLTVDSPVIHGDVLSAQDYLMQRETISLVPLNSNVVESSVVEIEFGFPDWASTASVTYHFDVRMRARETYGNPLEVYLSNRLVFRPKAGELGDVDTSFTVSRTVRADSPTSTVEFKLTGEPVPVSDPLMSVKVSGVYVV